MTSVETVRLLLRVPDLADAEALMGILWDPEVVEQKQVTLLEPPGGLDLALKNTNQMRRQWELRGYGHWSVIEKVTGHVIGCVGFYHPQRPWPGVDLGWVFHRSRWGQGFATEAATAALGWVWKYTEIDGSYVVEQRAPEVEATCSDSCRVLRVCALVALVGRGVARPRAASFVIPYAARALDRCARRGAPEDRSPSARYRRGQP
jgi:RimJ/RimL family protein N-acetyltransferase